MKGCQQLWHTQIWETKCISWQVFSFSLSEKHVFTARFVHVHQGCQWSFHVFNFQSVWLASDLKKSSVRRQFNTLSLKGQWSKGAINEKIKKNICTRTLKQISASLNAFGITWIVGSRKCNQLLRLNFEGVEQHPSRFLWKQLCIFCDICCLLWTVWTKNEINERWASDFSQYCTLTHSYRLKSMITTVL